MYYNHQKKTEDSMEEVEHTKPQGWEASLMATDLQTVVGTKLIFIAHNKQLREKFRYQLQLIDYDSPIICIR
jgi:hypothetical protein